jgi:hypothetical protein
MANIIILKKKEYCTYNASFNKGGIYKCFGSILVSQNSSVLSKLKVVQKICAQLQVAPRTRGKLT